jgi:uncharacterized protein YndB with AHSA1/START domain
MKRDLRFEEHYPHPLERVWEAITDSAAIAEWLMPNDFEPRLGHRFTFRTKPQPGFDGIVHCEVIALEPPRRLAYTWKGGGIDTVLTITLEPEPGGTKLVLEHTGFEGARGMMVSVLMSSGWGGRILRERLPQALARRAAAVS